MPGRFTLRIAGTGGRSQPRATGIENFDLPVERERGLDDRDSHLHVGDAELPLSEAMGRLRRQPRARCCRPISTTALDAPPGARSRGADEGASPPTRSSRRARLGHAAGARRPTFTVIARPLPDVPDGRSVIAGYPWFGDWGRDTMIALPGLCLATGRADVARLDPARPSPALSISGMLPNVFPGAGAAPEYNSVDAALWYFEAGAPISRRAADLKLRRASSFRFWPRSSTGTSARHALRHRASMPATACCTPASPGVQLTWMDAKVGDRVVTPRIGKPVEVNALWYNALVAMARFALR